MAARTLLLTVAFTLSLAPLAEAADYFVSPAGSDAGAGTVDAPLRTIQAAVDRAGPGDIVRVAPGTYRETVTFPRSGTADLPITLTTVGDGPVVLTGREPVEGWVLDDAAKGIWKAPMPWTLGTGRNQVFADGRVLIEARFPNDPAPGLGMYVSDLSPLWPTFGEFHIPKETSAEQPGRIVSPLLEGQPDDYWKGGLYYGVHYEGWCGQTGVIEGSKSGEITVGDRTQTWWFTGQYTEDEGRGMIVGHRNALDQPGEWLWDDDSLSLISLDGQQPAGIEAKARQLALDLSGREHIRVEGLTIRAASVRLKDSAWCVFDRCDLSYISHFTRQYSIGQVEHDRDTIASGETGILVGGHDNQFLNSSIRVSAGAGFHLRGYHHTIHNCLIDEVDYTSHYLNAITDAVSDFGEAEDTLVGGHVITFNTMRNAGRHMFNLSGNGTSLASRDRGPMDYAATLFAHNHLYNGMLQTRDAGLLTGYYCSGGTLYDLSTRIAYNVIHDAYDIFGMRIGALGLVYLDAGTCNVDLDHNLLWATPGSHQRGLWYNTMCVGIRESANVFRPEFERTCAELTSDDFPEGKPFRFGHDFADPPPIPQWPPVTEQLLPADGQGLVDGSSVACGEVDFDQGWQSVAMRFAGTAASMNTDGSSRAAPRHTKATDPLVLEATANDGTSEGVATQWTFVHTVRDGAWLRFAGVPLGEGYRRLRAVYGCDLAGPRWIEARLDAPDGPLVGRVELTRTDRKRESHVQIYAHASGALDLAEVGTRDVYLVFHAADGGLVGEFEYFRFEQYAGDLALQPTEVRVELRLDTPRGRKIADLYPRASERVFREIVGNLEPVAGRHPLYAVVRSALMEPAGTLAGLRLLRREGPETPPGIGVPPLTREGRMVLPPATNLPCARPNDRYPHSPNVVRPRERLGDALAELAAQGPPREGLALWLDASDEASLERDDQGRVSLWRDRSGAGRDAAQPDAGFRPSYEATGLNGKPSVGFHESLSTRLELPDFSGKRITVTVLAAFSNVYPPSEVNHDQRILTASDGAEFDYLTGIAATVPGMETGGPRLGAWVFADRWARHVRIGCFSPNYQTYFTGQLAEILVWSRTLTQLEQDRAMAYLVTKWDLRD